jgi:uncharacterized protein (TIGR02246 family)
LLVVGEAGLTPNSFANGQGSKTDDPKTIDSRTFMGERTMRIIATCVLLFPILLMAQPGAETDEQATRAVVDRFMDSWNRHDAKAFAAVFAEDADFTNVRGIGTSGRQKIEDFHAPVFATIFSKSYQEYTDIKTRFIRPDIAAVDVHWKMTGLSTRKAIPGLIGRDC